MGTHAFYSERVLLSHSSDLQTAAWIHGSHKVITLSLNKKCPAKQILWVFHPLLEGCCEDTCLPHCFSLSLLALVFCRLLSQLVPSNSLLFSILESRSIRVWFECVCLCVYAYVRACVRECMDDSVWESWVLQCLETASGEELPLSFSLSLALSNTNKHKWVRECKNNTLPYYFSTCILTCTCIHIPVVSVSQCQVLVLHEISAFNHISLHLSKHTPIHFNTHTHLNTHFVVCFITSCINFDCLLFQPATGVFVSICLFVYGHMCSRVETFEVSGKLCFAIGWLKYEGVACTSNDIWQWKKKEGEQERERGR